MPPTLTSAPAPVSEGPARLHLDFLDGVRAVAALYVVLGHSLLSCIGGLDAPHGFLINWLYYLHFAVDVFLVVSGFCLGLPVARHGTLRGGAAGFLRRRARRILPPYYVALALSVFIYGVVTSLLTHVSLTQPFHPNVFRLKSLAINLLLIQDLCPQGNWLNVAFWSVALEWKIYFLRTFA